MKRSLLLSVFATALLGSVAGLVMFNQVNSPQVTVHADRGDNEARWRPPAPTAPSAVGAWWGIARPCPADPATDASHVDLCKTICGTCTFVPGALPPEVPMMPSILADGNVVVNDAGSIPVFHTTAQGQWAADPDDPIQLRGRVRYQASFVWLQGSEDEISGLKVKRQFVGVARPRFVTYFDKSNPDEMFGYIQPHFFPIVGSNGLVNVQPSSAAGPFYGSHLPVLNFLGALPQGCQNNLGCLGTYHFTIHRIKPNVPN
ncbi:MAG: hypothetical protein ACKV22_21705 [Bryobacteraceae bacterium]